MWLRLGAEASEPMLADQPDKKDTQE